MATNVNVTFPPSRRDPRQVSNTLKRVLNFNDSDVALAAFANSLPAGAVVLKVMAIVLQAFNAGATNQLSLGQNAGHNDMITPADVNLTVVGSTGVTRGEGLAAIINSAADVAIAAIYAQTGAPATTGKVLLVVEFEGGNLT